jgi:hypothetical protein
MYLKQINEALGHTVTEGSDYQWNSFPDARILDYASEYATASVVFNTKTQEVYEASVDFRYNSDHRPYRWINQTYKDSYIAEFESRGLDPKIAWDDVRYIDLDIADDFIEKANCIFDGVVPDPRILVELDLDDATLLQIAKEAHKRDITLNQMIQHILQIFVDNHNSKNE